MKRKIQVSITVALVLLAGAVMVNATAGNERGTSPWVWQAQGFPPAGGQPQMGRDTWVLVAYDYNRDGQVDAYQYVYSPDLDRAIRASRERSDGAQRTLLRRYYGPWPRGYPAAQYGPGGPYTGAEPQPRQIVGTVRDTREVRLAQAQQSRLFAKIEAQQGRTVVVDLGPANQLRGLNISQGTRVQARGNVAWVNDRPVVMADRVSANNRTVDIDVPQASATRRLQGQITNVASKRLEGSGRPAHTVVLLRLTAGQTVPVDLGRQDDLRNVRVRTGENIILLARPMPIGDKMILVAQQIGAGGRIITVPWVMQYTGRQEQQARAR